jgi:hypothetical protein
MHNGAHFPGPGPGVQCMALLLVLCFSTATAAPKRTAGVLYEIWHTGAAHLMHRNQQAGARTLTVETVIRSDGNLTLDQVFADGGPPLPKGFSPDIYNVEPQLGFYCLYRPRPGENSTAATPDCGNITRVAEQHAAWLTAAGFDYVAIDVTNWPLVGGALAMGPNPNSAL